MKQTINLKLKRYFFKIAVSMTLLCCCFLSVPYSAISVQAQTEDCASVQPMSQDFSWSYKVENGKLYKRLYNQTTDEWIGDWIYVREYP